MIVLSRKYYKTILWAVITSLLLYLITLSLAVNHEVTHEFVLRDLGQIYAAETLPSISLGLISNIGILLWAASASITLFSLLFGLTKYSNCQPILSVGFAMSLLLCLDDFFLIHDRHQLNQDILYLIYPLLALFLLLQFRKVSKIYSPDSLLIACAFLGFSVITDIFQDFFPLGYEMMQIIEEAFKFIGIFTWLYFWSSFASFSIKNNFKKGIPD